MERALGAASGAGKAPTYNQRRDWSRATSRQGGGEKGHVVEPPPISGVGGSHAHLMGMCSERRFQEPCHGGNPMGPARKL